LNDALKQEDINKQQIESLEDINRGFEDEIN
jgi:hypothetical protein